MTVGLKVHYYHPIFDSNQPHSRETKWEAQDGIIVRSLGRSHSLAACDPEMVGVNAVFPK